MAKRPVSPSGYRALLVALAVLAAVVVAMIVGILVAVSGAGMVFVLVVGGGAFVAATRLALHVMSKLRLL